MKKLPIIFIVLLFALPGWAATYYVMPSGALNYSQKAAATACTNATAMNITAINHGSVNFVAGDIIDGCGQTYTDSIIPADVGESGNPIIYQNFKSTKAGGYGIDVNGKSYLTFRYMDINGSMFYIHGTSPGISAYYSIFRNCSDNYGIYVADSSDFTFNNLVVSDNYKAGIYIVTPATSIGRNSIIIGNGRDNATGGYRVTGTLDIDYSIITGNGVYPLWNTAETNVTDGGHNQKQILPKTASPKVNNAFFVFTSDDQNITYWESLNTVLSALDTPVKFTIFCYTQGLTAEKITSLQTLLAAGHEVGIHGRAHTDLTKTYPFTVTSSNTNPTINVDLTAKTITLSCDEVGNVVSVDWSATKKTTADLKTAVSGKGWTITTNTNVSDWIYLSTLADTSGAKSVSAGYQVLFDATAYWNDQIADTITWMTSNLGVAPTTIAPPFGATSAALRTYVKDTAGLLGLRTVGFHPYLSSVNIYDIGSFIAQYSLMDPTQTEAVVRANARGLYYHAIENGGVMVFLSHREVEMTAEQVGWFVDEIQKAGGKWVTFSQMITEIKVSHSTADNITYTKTYPNTSDYRLRAGSPAINAGVDVGLTTDADGKPIAGKPDIGAYEYQPTASGLLMCQ